MARSFVSKDIMAEPAQEETSMIPTQTNASIPVPVVSAKNLGKSYWLYPSVFRRVMGCFMPPERTGATPLKALSGLTFDLYPGEALALIGKNGAGKSTALQLLAGILQPTEGEYTVRGRMSALLELGSGFNPEFTGRDNISIAGTLAGLTKEEVSKSEAFIIEFADIGQYIDQPVKYYSSGMFLRLAFAVAIAGEPDLLIVDEALAVGDIFFRQKCYARLREMRERGTTVLLVTHSMGDVTEFCDKAVLLDRGRQIYYGMPKEAMVRYQFSTMALQQNNSSRSLDALDRTLKNEPQDESSWINLKNSFIEVNDSQQPNNVPGVSLLRYCLTNKKDIPTTVFFQGSWMRLYSEWRIGFPIKQVSPGLIIYTDKGQIVYASGAAIHVTQRLPDVTAPSVVYSCYEVQLPLIPGEYTLGHSIGCTPSVDIMNQRKNWGYEDWVAHAKRLGNLHPLTSIVITLPIVGEISRVKNFGLVDLPTKCSIYCKNE